MTWSRSAGHGTVGENTWGLKGRRSTGEGSGDGAGIVFVSGPGLMAIIVRLAKDGC